jgi:hypothetical protein
MAGVGWVGGSGLTPSNLTYLAGGMFVGVAVVFYQTDMPKAGGCETYRVSTKTATAYVLRPPTVTTEAVAAPVVAKEACQAAALAEREPPPADSISDDPPRHRHRHRRHWRH